MKREADPVESYCLDHSTRVPDYLGELERQTHLRTLAPQMMAGPLQGRLLSMISHMIRPKVVLEIGTFTGYSTLCLAEGLDEGGYIHTIEVNDELSYLSEEFFNRSPYHEKIRSHTGKAEDIIPTLDIKPELVFLDAGKQDYAHHYELCLETMAKGGFLLVDNVLWSKKVLYSTEDQATNVIHQFNKHVAKDNRVECVMLPLRDGITLIRKK